MTLGELMTAIAGAHWFSRLGEYRSENAGFIAVKSLAAWSGSAITHVLDSERLIAAEMDWLPSTQDSEDPFHGQSLVELAKERGLQEDLKQAKTKTFKAALDSLGAVEMPRLLLVGPHDFSPPAKGAALFAFRMAATEIVTDRQAQWCSLTRLYVEGFWPCGLMPSGVVVVF